MSNGDEPSAQEGSGEGHQHSVPINLCPDSTPLLQEITTNAAPRPVDGQNFVAPVSRSGSDETPSPFGTYASDTLHSELRKARLALYASHALATWGQRMWEFAVGLVMLELRPSSLQLVAICGLLGSAARFLAGGAVGEYVDRWAMSKSCTTKPTLLYLPKVDFMWDYSRAHLHALFPRTAN
jgi:Ferroportin1 (FPN1)